MCYLVHKVPGGNSGPESVQYSTVPNFGTIFFLAFSAALNLPGVFPATVLVVLKSDGSDWTGKY